MALARLSNASHEQPTHAKSIALLFIGRRAWGTHASADGYNTKATPPNSGQVIVAMAYRSIGGSANTSRIVINHAWLGKQIELALGNGGSGEYKSSTRQKKLHLRPPGASVRPCR
jgi:hypothetical protein